jgi:hypothetical protein
LKLLNLGQNDFSGDIPSSIRIEHNRSYSFLNNMPLLIRNLKKPNNSGKSLPYEDRWKRLIQNFNRFLKDHETLKYIRQDLLWVDVENMQNHHAEELEKILNEYLKAEEKYLLAKQSQGRFQNGLMVKNFEAIKSQTK